MLFPSFAASLLVLMCAPGGQVRPLFLFVVKCKLVHELQELDCSLLRQQTTDRVCLFLFFPPVASGYTDRCGPALSATSLFLFFFFLVVFSLSASIFCWDANGIQKTCLFSKFQFLRNNFGKCG